MSTPSSELLQKIGAENRRHQTRIRNLRYPLLKDETADPIDRVAMGMTGSSYIHAAYQEVGALIKANQGEPLIVLRFRRGPEITRAIGGIIADEVEPLLVGNGDEVIDSAQKDAPLPRHAMLRVPVSRHIDYALYNDGEGGYFRGAKVRDDGEDKLAVSTTHVDVAHFAVVNSADTGSDFHARVEHEDVLVGERIAYWDHISVVSQMLELLSNPPNVDGELIKFPGRE